MQTRILYGLSAYLILCLSTLSTHAAGPYYVIDYPASEQPQELQLAVTYTLWIPPECQTIRGVIVHQHGCGKGACDGGKTAAYDLHWQALARATNCALLGPSYHQEDKQNCRLWCDPRNGSAATFLRALTDFAKQSGHPELATAPWCLWGHSGGGFWVSLMQAMYPERIVAIWFRSGTAYATWKKGEIPAPELTAAAYEIPAMCNPGAKEKDDMRFKGAWEGTWSMFQAYREQGAPIGFAPDPLSSHDCGGSRYLAIPFFKACLELRLPASNVAAEPGRYPKLRSLSSSKAYWLATALEPESIQPAAKYQGDAATAVWLPNEAVAKAWAEYTKTGLVSDATPPPAAFDIKVTATDKGNEIRWNLHADMESGVGSIVILRDGQPLATLPEKGKPKAGRNYFQGLSYHDTPEPNHPPLLYLDQTADKNKQYQYQVQVQNTAGANGK